MSETLLQDNTNLLALADASRKVANGKLKVETKSAFGQYMTPASTAAFMASLFPQPAENQITLLDPGAGVGSLTSAFVARISKHTPPCSIDVDAWELDPVMYPYLEKNLSLCRSKVQRHGGSFSWRILREDFILESVKNILAANSLWAEQTKKYSHCIMNPPYKKIAGDSRHRSSLRSIGIETVNLYSAFVAVSLSLLKPGGHLVAIIPRSFCNGPYYRPFREFIFKHSAIHYLHLFSARDKAFQEDRVLQENIIIMLEKAGPPRKVTISTSTDDTFSDLSTASYSFPQIVHPDDPEMFLHIPLSPEKDRLAASDSFRYSLDDLGIQVSTGPVVDFRLKPYLRSMPEPGTVPLLYPCHFSSQSTRWPIAGGKKPNAILLQAETEKWLYPNGFYTVVRRFSSKEEKRRIIASAIDPGYFPGVEWLGLENHLNVFHSDRKGLPESIARGLALYLNSTAVDNNFRRFSGHTQVNAADLKRMKYPAFAVLKKLGHWAMHHKDLTQDMIDEQIEKIAE